MMQHVLTRSLDRSATVFLLVVAAVGVLIPLSNLLLPEGSLFQVPTYLMSLFGKYVCYAILALSIDLIWGYCGILSLARHRGLSVDHHAGDDLCPVARLFPQRHGVRRQ